MLRISGVTIPNEKRAEIGLTYLFGIGRVTSNKILKQAQIDPNIRIKDLTEEQENKLRQLLEKEYKIEGNLRREVITNIKRLKEIGKELKNFMGKKYPSSKNKLMLKDFNEEMGEILK